MYVDDCRDTLFFWLNFRDAGVFKNKSKSEPLLEETGDWDILVQ